MRYLPVAPTSHPRGASTSPRPFRKEQRLSRHPHRRPPRTSTGLRWRHAGGGPSGGCGRRARAPPAARGRGQRPGRGRRDNGRRSRAGSWSLAYARIATSSASGRSRMMLSPSLVVGRPSAWIAWGDQSGLGRRWGSLDPPAVPTDPEVVRGAERQIPRMPATADLLL